MLFATDLAEADALLKQRTAADRGGPKIAELVVRDFQSTLHAFATGRNASLDVHGFPERIRCLSPLDFGHVKDILRYSGIWRSLKRAYGARLAFAEFRAHHVMVTDPDGFAWKDVAPRDIVRHSHRVYYSDHRGSVGKAEVAARFERPPRPDTNARARFFCSVHPWARTLRSTAYDEHAARWAIGRDWAAWEESVGDLRLMPSPDADLADDALLVLERASFDDLWSTIEAFHRAPFAEAVLLALTSPASLYKHCVRGDVLFLELTCTRALAPSPLYI